MVEKIKSSYSIELTGLFLFLLVLISNLIIIEFAEGYFDYYDVPISLIDFNPQVYDYVTVALPSIIATLLIMVILYSAVKFGGYIGNATASRLIKNDNLFTGFIRKINMKQGLVGKIEKATNVLFVCVMIYIIVFVGSKIIFDVVPNLGRTKAAQTMQYHMIINESNSSEKELIIYTNNSNVVTKKYNTKTNEFSDEYRVIVKSDYRVKSIDIRN